MIQKNTIGNKDIFAIEYTFFADSHDTEIALYVNGQNVLAFERNGKLLTTRWNIDELAMWLRKFVDNMQEDPYPVDCAGDFAAQKDDNARTFDSDDDEVFEAYYQRIYDWNCRHRWHAASSGAILADVYFQLIGEKIEISWDNRGIDDNVTFSNLIGGARIPKGIFHSTINTFLKEYAEYWYN